MDIEHLHNDIEYNYHNNIIQYLYFKKYTLCEITFNNITKQLNFNYIKFNKNEYLSKDILRSFNILIGAHFIADIDVWKLIKRPTIKQYYYKEYNLDTISEIDIQLIKEIIRLTLKKCREKNYIYFDTDKDIRRCISINLKKTWYPFPG